MVIIENKTLFAHKIENEQKEIGFLIVLERLPSLAECGLAIPTFAVKTIPIANVPWENKADYKVVENRLWSSGISLHLQRDSIHHERHVMIFL